LGSAVEHEIAGRNDWRPVEDRLRQIQPRVGIGNRYAVIVLAVRDERPAVVLALFDQIEFVAAGWPVLHLPQLAGGYL
jgi:hypothetical protein